MIYKLFFYFINLKAIKKFKKYLFSKKKNDKKSIISIYRIIYK